MNTWINIARYHMVDRLTYTALPWIIQGFSFALSLAIFAALGASTSKASYSGALATIYIFFCVIGGWSISRRLQFALTLGVSRRSYYAGTALLAVSLAAVDGLALTVLQLIERATDGWGIGLHFFRVPYILPGPWYLTWLTSFVGLALMFVYGMWYGLVYQRWNLFGLLIFIAAQVTVAAAVVLIATGAHDWAGVGRFFTTLTVAGLTGVLAVLAAALLASGYATIRRVTV
jgi:hypothetical protein